MNEAIPSVIYGHDTRGHPVTVNLAGPSPHAFATGGTGSGLTTLVGVIAARAAAQGSKVVICQPRADTDFVALPGLTPAPGLEETLQLIIKCRDEMNQRLADMAAGAEPGGFPHMLLAVDDGQELLAASAAGSCGAALDALGELAAFGRAARVGLLIAAHTVYGLPARLLINVSTRIVLGRVTSGLASYLLGPDIVRRGVTDAPGSGTAITGDGPPATIQVDSPLGGQQ